MTRTALLWVTHVWSDDLKQEFEKFLALRYPGSPDIWLLPDAHISREHNLAGQYSHCFEFDASSLFERLPYQRLEGKGLLHNTHFPLMDFFRAHPGYDYYWYVEFDVRYTGDWGSFIQQFDSRDDDFITSHIRRFSEEPGWYWWSFFHHPKKEIPREHYIRSFNVIFRISSRALKYIHGQLEDGWQGHCEVSFPTLLYHGRFRLRDFGGDGGFVYPGMVNRNYTSQAGKWGLLNPFCSVHWRPSSTHAGLRKNRIYHPVKPLSMTEPWKEWWNYYKMWMRQYLDFW
jgi:hypothetical protein